jgi:L-fucose mutarotase
MLKNIDPLLSPKLLMLLRSMGHGDEIAIVDANYPAESSAQRLERLDGVSATRVLRAIVSLMPLDSYVDCPVHTMQVVDNHSLKPEVVCEFERIIADADDSVINFGTLERFAFYERVKNSYAIVVTGERRLYGNILLKKGVINPDD